MTSATTPVGVIGFKYNGLEQRASKSGATTTYYVYDEAGQVLGEYDSNGNPVYETAYLGMIPVGVLKQTGSAASSNLAVTLYNVHADQIATPRVITRQDHTIVWRWDAAEAFGATVSNQNPSVLGVFVYNQRFPGQVADGETGLNQNWNRELDPRTGRYHQFDPIGLRGGPSGYAYAGSNPLTFTDPTGLKHKANSAHCKALRRKIQNSRNEVDTRWRELDANIGRLPERLGPGEALSSTRRGHRTLINKEDNVLRKWEKRYDDECEPEDKDQGGDCDECSAGATMAATMVGGYLVYRCIRMLPSLLPPLWWTMPANLGAP